EDGIRAFHVTGVQTCALPISAPAPAAASPPACLPPRDGATSPCPAPVATHPPALPGTPAAASWTVAPPHPVRRGNSGLWALFRRSEERRVGKAGRSGWPRAVE